MKRITFSLEDIEFLNSLNSSPNPESNIFVTAQHGYVRNLDHGVLQHLENTYKRTINPDFVLTFHCSSCVLTMIQELGEAYAKFQGEEAAIAEHAATAAQPAEGAGDQDTPPADPPAGDTLPPADAPPAGEAVPPPPPPAKTTKAPKAPKAAKGTQPAEGAK